MLGRQELGAHLEEAKTTEYYDSWRSEVGILRCYVMCYRNVADSLGLIGQLYKRDYLAGHRRAFLSYFWIVIGPLLGVVSWVFMHHSGFLNVGDVGVSYPAYVLLGTSLWGVGIGLYQASQSTLNSATSLMTQIRYPHEVILVKQVLVFLTNQAIALSANFVVLAFMGIDYGYKALLFPVLLIPLFLFAVGIGLVMSMVTVVLSDVTSLINAGLGLLVFFTPIMYAPKADQPMIKKMMDLNPLTHLVCTPRDWILYGRLYDPQSFLYCSIAAAIIFLVSLRLFFLAENRLVEKIL